VVVSRALRRMARRRTDPLLVRAATWALALRTVLLAVLATVAGTRVVANRSAGLVAVYGVLALTPWMAAGIAIGSGRSRPATLIRAGVRVLVVHAVLLLAALASWAQDRLA
jgi:hypothetical protein